MCFYIDIGACRVENGARSDGKIEMKGEIMDAMNWVAVIGAAAWTPQIITWVYRFFTKPKVSIYLHSKPEIGYTSLGPIFNIRCALLSKHKDAVLNKFSAKLRHSSGASYTFDWAGLSEDLSEIQNPIGPTISIKKTSLPLVVKVLHTNVSQMLVRFMHKRFRVEISKVSAPALDRFNFLKTSCKLNTEKDIEDLAKEQDFVDILKFYNSEFIWSAGKYTVTFEFDSPNKFKYKKSEYTFELKQDDIDNLKKNIENIRHDLIEMAKLDCISDYELKPTNWVWRNPELQEKGQVKLSTH